MQYSVELFALNEEGKSIVFGSVSYSLPDDTDLEKINSRLTTMINDVMDESDRVAQVTAKPDSLTVVFDCPEPSVKYELNKILRFTHFRLYPLHMGCK